MTNNGQNILPKQCNENISNSNQYQMNITNQTFSKIILGNTHQGSSKYYNISVLCGSTCMTNSLISLAYSKNKNTNQWTSNDIDEILFLGINLYKLLYPNRIIQDNSTYLTVNDLNINFSIDNKYFQVTVKQSFCGNMLQQQTNIRNVLPTIEEAFENAFQISNCCILILKEYGMSIHKIQNKYYLFDPHSRNKEGLSTENGYAILGNLTNEISLFKHLRNLCKSFTNVPLKDILFELTAIDINIITPSTEIQYNLKTTNTISTNKELQQLEQYFNQQMILQEQFKKDQFKIKNNYNKINNKQTLTNTIKPKSNKNYNNIDDHYVLRNNNNKGNLFQTNNTITKNIIKSELPFNTIYKEVLNCNDIKSTENIKNVKETKISKKRLKQKQAKEYHNNNYLNKKQKEQSKKEQQYNKQIKDKIRYSNKKIQQLKMTEQKENVKLHCTLQEKKVIKQTENYVQKENMETNNIKTNLNIIYNTGTIDKQKLKQNMENQNTNTNITNLFTVNDKNTKEKNDKHKKITVKTNYKTNTIPLKRKRQYEQKNNCKDDINVSRTKILKLDNNSKNETIKKFHSTKKKMKQTHTKTNNKKEILNPKHKKFLNILNFLFNDISIGPTFICTCCKRFLYKSITQKYKQENYNTFTEQYLKDNISISESNNSVWICKTCHLQLKRGKLPAQASANNLSTIQIPNELSNLCTLERQLISQIIPFMKIVQLPVGNQHGIRGQVVLVPSNLQKTTDSLPRNISESQIIALTFKRRLKDKHHVKKQYIRPQSINEAIAWLKKYNNYYKHIITNKEWNITTNLEDEQLCNSSTEKSTTKKRNNCKEINYHNKKRKISNNTNNDNIKTINNNNNIYNESNITDSEEELNNQIPEHIRTEQELNKSIHNNTCIYPKEGPTVQSNQEMQIAPGEGQIPTNTYQTKNWEALTFPTLFPNGENTFNTKRPIPISVQKYINVRLLSKDTRFAESPEYTFQCLHWAETINVQNQITIHLKKQHQVDLNAGQIKNKEKLQALHKENQLFCSYRKLRGSPQYWKDMRHDMIAKLRHFGPYTFFLSGSAADFHWPELIKVIAKQYQEDLTIDDINKMTPKQKRNYLARNPVTVARHIDYIFEQTWKQVILSGLHPIGQILNYDIRKEMQSRGTQHFHSAIHVKDAPTLQRNSKEDVITFIDKHISCKIPEEDIDKNLHELVITRQTHHHTKTCKKKLTLPCRFHFKRPPSNITIITDAKSLTTKEINDNKKIISSVMTILDKTDKYKNVEEIIQQTKYNEEQYHNALNTNTKQTIMYKRKPNETSINPYNPYILKALRSNMDIQYVLNVWACIAYISSYMCKAEKQMSDLMKQAVKEADTVRDKLKAI